MGKLGWRRLQGRTNNRIATNMHLSFTLQMVNKYWDKVGAGSNKYAEEQALQKSYFFQKKKGRQFRKEKVSTFR